MAPVIVFVVMLVLAGAPPVAWGNQWFNRGGALNPAGGWFEWVQNTFDGRHCALGYGGHLQCYDPISNFIETVYVYQSQTPGPERGDLQIFGWDHVAQEYLAMDGGRSIGPDPMAFSMVTRTWRILTDADFDQIESRMISSSAGSATSPDHDLFIVFAGAQNGNPGRMALVYDLRERTYRELLGPPTMPARHWTMGQFLYIASLQQFLLFGGNGAPGTGVLNDIWLLDPVTWAWTPVAAQNPPVGRYFSQMAYDHINDVVYLYGGHGAGDQATGSMVSVLHLDTWTWEHIPAPPGTVRVDYPGWRRVGAAIFDPSAGFCSGSGVLEGTDWIGSMAIWCWIHDFGAPPPPPPPPSPPPVITLEWNGLLADRVSAGFAASPDGAVDGVLTMALTGGVNRTLSSLTLQRAGGGTWDTIPNSFWILGVSGNGGPLVNRSDTSVSIPLTVGETLTLFISNYQGVMFTTGSMFTLTARFQDGTSAQASAIIASAPPPPPPPPPSPAPVITLEWNGLLADRVSAGFAASPDGAVDGVLTMALTGGVNRTLSSLTLQRAGGGTWDTIPNSFWILGVSGNGGPLVNRSDTSVSIPLTVGETLTLFISNYQGVMFTTGSMFTLTARFQDGTSAQASAIIASAPPPPPPPPPSPAPVITLEWNGLLADRVSAGFAASPDGAVDGVLTMALTGGVNRTLSSLTLQRAGGGTWDTIPNSFWILGVSGNGGPLVNRSDTSVSIPLTVGETLTLFISNYQGVMFTAGSMFTLTARFQDGTSAQASAIIASAPPLGVVLPWRGF